MNQIQLLKERQSIEIAVEALESVTGFTINWTQENAHDKGIDGYIILNNEIYPIEHKQTFRISQIPHILQIKKQHPNLLLISDSLSEDIKTVLRNNKINYLDIAGNAYIQIPNSLILINGQKKLIKNVVQKDKAFTKKGLIVVFHLLNDESLLNQTYRQICQVTGVSLDTITKVIQSLKQQRFIYQINAKTMRLTDKKYLFEKWADAYENRLKPDLFVGNFRFQNIDSEKNWRNLELKEQSIWGGEPAADILTDFIRPAIFTLYSTEKKGDLMRNYRLVPDSNGNIQVYSPFFNIDSLKTINALLVYADMLNSGDSRNLEVAQKIYEKHVKNILE